MVVFTGPTPHSSRLAAPRRAISSSPGLRTRAGDVAEVRAGGLPPEWDAADVVVLDPPRVGAKRAAVEQVVARQPRAVAYVACDPAALARDVAPFAEHGYELSSLRAFDLFPMTHHVECVALLEPDDRSDPQAVRSSAGRLDDVEDSQRDRE